MPPGRSHHLDAGVTVKRIGAVADLLAHRVLEQPVDDDHIASSKLFAPAHLLLHHLAVVGDEFEIEIAHRSAGFALANRGLFDVAQAPAEGEIGRLDNILHHRAVDFRGCSVDESGVALELGEAEGRPEALDHRVHKIGNAPIVLQNSTTS